VIDPELLATLARLQGQQVRVTVEGVAKLGRLRRSSLPGPSPDWWLDDRSLLVSQVTKVERRLWNQWGKLVGYTTAWERDA
jgi:hypothetical protein